MGGNKNEINWAQVILIVFIFTAPTTFFAWATLATKATTKGVTVTIETLLEEVKTMNAETEGWIDNQDGAAQ